MFTRRGNIEEIAKFNIISRELATAVHALLFTLRRIKCFGWHHYFIVLLHWNLAFGIVLPFRQDNLLWVLGTVSPPGNPLQGFLCLIHVNIPWQAHQLITTRKAGSCVLSPVWHVPAIFRKTHFILLVQLRITDMSCTCCGVSACHITEVDWTGVMFKSKDRDQLLLHWAAFHLCCLYWLKLTAL